MAVINQNIDKYALPSWSSYRQQADLYLPILVLYFLSLTSFDRIGTDDVLFGQSPEFYQTASLWYSLLTLLMLAFEHLYLKVLQPGKKYTHIDAFLKISWLALTFIICYLVSGINPNGVITVGEGVSQKIFEYDGLATYTPFILVSLICFSVLILRGWKRQRQLF